MGEREQEVEFEEQKKESKGVQEGEEIQGENQKMREKELTKGVIFWE